jgi:hypothetical protein
MGLNLAVPTHNGAFLNFHEGTDETVVSDFAVIEVAGLDHLHPNAPIHIDYLAL